MKEKISRNKISRHYKSFFELDNMALGENDNLMIDWGESLINELVNQEAEKRIEERQDEMEAGFLERWIRTFNLYSDTSAFCNGYRRMREERDRLVSSQKTEGGGE